MYRDRLLFSPDRILDVNRNEQDETTYRERLISKLEFFLKKMDSLKISDIDSEFSAQGIDFKIYMKSSAVLIYVADGKRVRNPEWINYLKSMKRIDENWYYAMIDK